MNSYKNGANYSNFIKLIWKTLLTNNNKSRFQMTSEESEYVNKQRKNCRKESIYLGCNQKLSLLENLMKNSTKQKQNNNIFLISRI